MERPVTVQRSTTKGEDAGAAHLEEGVGVVLETGGLVALKTARVRTVLGAESQITGAGSVRRRTVCVVGKILEKCLWREVVKMAENMSSVYYTSVELDWVN